MEKQNIRISIRMLSFFATLVLAMMIVLPVHAAPDTAIDYEIVFDSTYYAEHNPDLQAVFGNDSNALLTHFITCGMAEGRQANSEFNVWYYKAKYPELQTVFGDNLVDYYIHYIFYGKAAGLIGSGDISTNNTVSVTDAFNPAAPTLSVEEKYAQEVLELVNQVRAENGLGSLSTTPQLMKTAQLRASEAATLFSHTRPDGSSCFTAFEQNGVEYGRAGENIAAGQSSPESVMNSWLNSPGHRANILNSGYKHIGIGCYQTKGGYGIYWAQCFTD